MIIWKKLWSRIGRKRMGKRKLQFVVFLYTLYSHLACANTALILFIIVLRSPWADQCMNIIVISLAIAITSILLLWWGVSCCCNSSISWWWWWWWCLFKGSCSIYTYSRQFLCIVFCLLHWSLKCFHVCKHHIIC